MKKHVHFIGIAGHAMAAVAKMFKDSCWRVTGSDQKAVFPPVTTYLRENHIAFTCGYSARNLVGKPDLVVVGRSALLVDRQNPEVEEAKKRGYLVRSYPEVLRDFLVKENSIVVVGTYGKTTSTALISWILNKAGLNPSFMIGGPPLDFPDGVRQTSSPYSVIEGDETPAMSENDLPKFMFYKPKFVLLTAAQWDHPEIFKTEEEYLLAFSKFVKLVPKEGILVACKDGQNTDKIAKSAKCPVFWYSLASEDADFWMENASLLKEKTQFEVVGGSYKRISLETLLLGRHNLQNITGAVALCCKLGIPKEVVKKAVATFRGVRNRLEKLGLFSGVVLFCDFAQHPVRVKETLAAIRTRYPNDKIFCVFDPHSTLLQQRESLNWYRGSFDLANQVIVTKVSFSKAKTSARWVKGSEIVEAIGKTQPKVFYEPIDQKVVNFLTRKVQSGDVILFLSSGGLRTIELIKEVQSQLEGRDK